MAVKSMSGMSCHMWTVIASMHIALLETRLAYAAQCSLRTVVCGIIAYVTSGISTALFKMKPKIACARWSFNGSGGLIAPAAGLCPPASTPVFAGCLTLGGPSNTILHCS